MVDDSAFTFNYITGDPCYKCRFACRIPYYKVCNPFQRHFRCTSIARRNDLLETAKDILNKPNSTTDDILKAYQMLQEVVSMDTDFKQYGSFECTNNFFLPGCYTRDFKNITLNILWEAKMRIDKRLGHIIKNGEDIFGIELELSKTINENCNLFEERSIKDAMKLAASLIEKCEAELEKISNGKTPTKDSEDKENFLKTMITFLYSAMESKEPENEKKVETTR